MAPAGHAGLTQSQPFVFSAQLLQLMIWSEEGIEENEKERGKKRYHSKFVKARAKAEGKGDPQLYGFHIL